MFWPLTWFKSKHPCQFDLMFSFQAGDFNMSNNKGFHSHHRVREQPLDSYWCQNAGVIEGPESVYKMLTSAGGRPDIEWPRRVLHHACLTAKHIYTLAVKYKPLWLLHACRKKNYMHPHFHCCGRLMSADTHVCTHNVHVHPAWLVHCNGLL